jgi:RNase adaptor protein for sRNA GlmZ degradation
MATAIVSFGFRHGNVSIPCSVGIMVIDVRKEFDRNPYRDRALRYLRGTDVSVQKDILKTPNFHKSYAQLKKKVEIFDGIVYLGCTGGHHRSVYLALRLAEELGVPVQHRDIDKK